MTLTAHENGTSPMRQAAEAAEAATGLRAEIIWGVLMISPTPRFKHARVINVINEQLMSALPEGLEAFQVASVALPCDPDDHATTGRRLTPAGARTVRASFRCRRRRTRPRR